jgi:homoserine dehydrogenase
MSKPTTKFTKSEAGRKPLRTVRIGLVGLGTVGTGTVKDLLAHQQEIQRRLDCKLELKTVCALGITQQDVAWIGPHVKATEDWHDVTGDPEIDIVVELVGVLSVARPLAFAAIGAGKHFVTANKQLIAEHGVELAERARAAQVNMGIEACVAGGTPLLHAIREGLAAEQFDGVYGILNGTTNYILTEMERRGCRFAEVLAEAQQKGYAEPDPTFDVQGYDARYKIAILAMLCFGQAVRVDDIPAQGITAIDQVDFAYARRLNHTIRLIASARRRDGGRLEIFVRPMMIPASSQLAKVLGSLNGILLMGDKGGNFTFTGRGAGGDPTGIAVLSDIIGIARGMAGEAVSSPLGYETWQPARIAPASDNVISAYLRLVVRDRPGILARVCALLARHRINIDSVLQEPGMPKNELPFVMTLEPTREKQVAQATAEIARLPFMACPPLMMPFAELP